MKFAGVVPVLVKLQRPPPDIRIFLPQRFARSITATRRPRWPAVRAHMRPAAPPPITIASYAPVTAGLAERARASASRRDGSHLPHDRHDRDAFRFARELQFAFLDEALQPHAALEQRRERFRRARGQLDHREVAAARKRRGGLLPPDPESAAAVADDRDLPCAAARLADARLVGLAELDPELDLAVERASPEIGLVLAAKAPTELE